MNTELEKKQYQCKILGTALLTQKSENTKGKCYIAEQKRKWWRRG